MPRPLGNCLPPDVAWPVTPNAGHTYSNRRVVTWESGTTLILHVSHESSLCLVLGFGENAFEQGLTLHAQVQLDQEWANYDPADLLIRHAE